MYLWIKAFHLIFMVAWFAGLFYIFRLFVYHVKYKDDSKLAAVYQVMEHKLLCYIMHPAMLLTVFFGGWLVYLNPQFLQQHWLRYKLVGVASLVAYQIFCHIVHVKFERKKFFLSEKACRIINEVPTLFLIMIILLVVLKP
ncbi:CopD family protein [bacterium]|nr:CopD family protein [bacterium]